MKTKYLYFSWLCLFILSAAMGFIQERNGAVIALLAALSVAFFVPGGLLLYHAISRGQRTHLCNVLIISAVSLVLTLVMIAGNFLVVLAPENAVLAAVLYVGLVILTAPMMCAPVWVLSIFLWACLLFTAVTFWKKTK